MSTNSIFTGRFRKAKNAKFLHADNEASDHSARMFSVGSTYQKVLFLRCGSILFWNTTNLHIPDKF